MGIVVQFLFQKRRIASSVFKANFCGWLPRRVVSLMSDIDLSLVLSNWSLKLDIMDPERMFALSLIMDSEGYFMIRLSSVRRNPLNPRKDACFYSI